VGLFSDFTEREERTDQVDLPAVMSEHLSEAITRSCVAGLEAALSLAALVRQMRAVTPARARAMALGALRELAVVDASMTETLAAVRSARDAVALAAESLTLKLSMR
jgi:hypothetical protein